MHYLSEQASESAHDPSRSDCCNLLSLVHIYLKAHSGSPGMLTSAIAGAISTELDSAGILSWPKSDTQYYSVPKPVLLGSEPGWRAVLDGSLFTLHTMRVIALLATLYLVVGSLATSLLASCGGGPGSISQSTYDELVRYTKYSSGAYHLVCLKPLGNHLVQSVGSYFLLHLLT